MALDCYIDDLFYERASKVEGKPYKEFVFDDEKLLRIFPEDTDEEMLKWHWDEEDREVYPLHKTDWEFQFDNELPQQINSKLEIPKGVFHRLIKGTGELRVIVYKQKQGCQPAQPVMEVIVAIRSIGKVTWLNLIATERNVIVQFS